MRAVSAGFALAKRMVYVAVVVSGIGSFIVGYLLMCISTRAAVLVERCWPGAGRGNCWSFALPLFAKHGGYLVVRPADDVRVMRRFRVPHVIWLHELPHGAVLRSYGPAGVRSNAKWVPWEVLWYRGKVSTTEAPHPSAWGDL